MEQNNQRTELEKQVDQEIIAKGKDVVNDFDPTQSITVPPKESTLLKAIPVGLQTHMRATVEKEASDPEAYRKIITEQLKHKRKQAKNKESKPPQIVCKDNQFMLYDDAMTMCFYELISLNDPKVDAILTKAEFTMVDLNGKPIFPKPKSN